MRRRSREGFYISGGRLSLETLGGSPGFRQLHCRLISCSSVLSSYRTYLKLASHNDNGESIWDWGWAKLQLLGYCTRVLPEFGSDKVCFSVLLVHNHCSGSRLSLYFL